MTTIIYEHKSKTIACDSRAVANGVIGSDNCIKWRYKNENLFFFAGLICEFEDFIGHYGVKSKPELSFQTSSIMVNNGKTYFCGIDERDGWWQEELNYNVSIGSGKPFALSALDFGRTPKQAVRYASTRDIYTGGKCHVFDIEKMTFI